MDAAVAAARRAFDTGPWPRLTPAERGRVLVRIAELLEERSQLLALTVTLEMGKPIADAHGRDKSVHAIEKYTELKTTWIQL